MPNICILPLFEKIDTSFIVVINTFNLKFEAKVYYGPELVFCIEGNPEIREH